MSSSNNVNVDAEIAFPSASKFENFILLLQSVFELERFEPPIGLSGFWLRNPYHATDRPQNCTKGYSICTQSKSSNFKFLNSKFLPLAVSKLLRFQPLVAEKPLNLDGKKQREFQREASRKSYNKERKQKSQYSRDSNVGAGTTSPGASKFENFILRPQLVFELERFKPAIGFSVFWLALPYHATVCPQNSKDCSLRSPSKF